MNMHLLRVRYTADYTEGVFYLDGDFFGFTLEDTWRLISKPTDKVRNMTCIPRGVYEVIVNESLRFKKRMALLLQVPFFDGVRLHGGRNANDTEGCPLIMPSRGNTPGTLAGTLLTDRLTALLDSTPGPHLLHVIDGHPGRPG